MSLPDAVHRDILQLLKAKISDQLLIKDFKPVSGGCINNGGKLSTSEGDFFVKWNNAQRFPKMFYTESRGLALLASAKAIHTPEVIGTTESDLYQSIVMEFISSQPPSTNYWQLFGQRLATLHQQSNTLAGLDHQNYIGSLPQSNSQNESWTEFFITQRLATQLNLSDHKKIIDKNTLLDFDLLFKKLDTLLPAEKKSLLHGDLWSGNLIIDEKGAPSLIDPAVYYGHREVDIAMTQLFGGFDPSYLDAYQEIWPLQNGWKERIDLYNLYPLLVHLNLFGNSYLTQIRRILKRFVS